MIQTHRYSIAGWGSSVYGFAGYNLDTKDRVAQSV
jgi:hypothetical protein